MRKAIKYTLLSITSLIILLAIFLFSIKRFDHNVLNSKDFIAIDEKAINGGSPKLIPTPIYKW